MSKAPQIVNKISQHVLIFTPQATEATMVDRSDMARSARVHEQKMRVGNERTRVKRRESPAEGAKVVVVPAFIDGLTDTNPPTTHPQQHGPQHGAPKSFSLVRRTGEYLSTSNPQPHSPPHGAAKSCSRVLYCKFVGHQWGGEARFHVQR